MAQDPPGPRHRIFLLTMWEERSRDPQTPIRWRFSLMHPATGQRRGFASLAALVAALEQATGEADNWARKEEADN